MNWLWKRSAELALFAGAGFAGLAMGFVLAWWQCEATAPPPRPEEAQLLAQVAAALDDNERAAGRYAAFYALLAERLEAGRYPTTTRAAGVAAAAAEILELPGLLEEIVAGRLNPLLGEPGPLTAETAAAAADRLRALAAACQEVAR